MNMFRSAWQRIAVCTRDVIGLLALVALVTAPPCFARSTETYPALSSHVTDRAGVLGGGAVRLGKKLEAFEAATGKQVFVLTVPSTGGRPIDQYAVEVFEQWKVGRGGIDDGVLFVIAVADRRMRIEVGYGLEGTLTDAQCARIIRDMVAPQFASGRFDAGIEAGVEALMLTLSPASAAYFPQAQSPAPAALQEVKSGFSNGAVAFVSGMLFVVALTTIGAGIGGLLLFILLSMLLPLMFPGVQGTLLFLATNSVWLAVRWRLIANNVRKHHLPSSNKPLWTWIRVFCVPGVGDPNRKAFTFTVSSGSSSTGNGSQSEGACSGHGGRSGGGGASGSW